VSLPFSDHCQPLADSAGEVQVILDHLQKQASVEGWRYVEVRPLSDENLRKSATEFKKGLGYGFHSIDLRPELGSIFGKFHDSCVRRKIRRAEREQLSYEAGRSEALFQKFHHLFLLTRRRHKLPPQPVAWFRNLIGCVGQQLTIHVASKDSDPVASILTVSNQNSVVYKYGCSDSRFNNMGGTQFLFWKVIQAGKAAGAEVIDLGRSDLEDPGLAAFKGHLGGVPSELNYYRYSLSPPKASVGPKLSYLRHAFAQTPNAIFSGAGRMFYRHLG
jgi:lipid II:glycine glycyltransferase (peptidoglycan interpeptide bridge formation enzyme)